MNIFSVKFAALVLVILVPAMAFATTCPVLPKLNWIPGSDWINVKDHGVKGDGVTDDAGSIQAVINT